MNSNKILPLCLLMWSLFAWHTRAQQQPFPPIEGTLIDSESLAPIPYAHIYTLDRQHFSLSNHEGYFSLQLRGPGTIIVSAVGYHARFIRLTNPETLQEHITIEMERKRIALAEIIVYGNDPMRGFYTHDKKKRASSKKSTLLARPSLGRAAPDGGVGIVIEGVLTAIANQFNAEYRQLKKLEALRREKLFAEYYDYLLKKRIPNELLTKYTHFLATERAAFFAFWQPSLSFLEAATTYAIVEKLKAQESEYIAHIYRTKAYKMYPERISSLELRRLLTTTTHSSKKE